MITIVLLLLGLCFGSFANAAVWRLYKQESVKSKKVKKQYSITQGRSMCPHCRHTLGLTDLIPVISWLTLKGKCRYCKKPISAQYPAVELTTATLFITSYIWWPYGFHNGGLLQFVLWLVFLVGFMVLLVYDLRWFLLPDRVVYPLIWLALAQVLVLATVYGGGLHTVTTALWGVVVASGLFWALFQISDGKWIGGGDVKLGVVLGLLVGGPVPSMLMIFTASLLGTVYALPLMLMGRAKASSRVPFGPFMIMATIIVYLFGSSLIAWFKQHFLVAY